MALPTTEMNGYQRLRHEIQFALDRCQEQQRLDFKESQPWPTLKFKLIKTIMAMANLRDGGLIIIGVSERDDIWTLTGISEQHLSTFTGDEVLEQVCKYASPEIALDIVLHLATNDKQYLAINVHQFSECPVVCKCHSPQDIPAKDKFSPGDFFIRPPGKPRTERITQATQLHDLLELSAEHRARRMLAAGNRIGLVPAASTNSRFDDEIADIGQNPGKILQNPHWHVVIRPDTYQENHIESRSQLLNIVQKARVSLRGWDFPFVSPRDDEIAKGSNWIGSQVDFMGTREFWRFYQSGQFTQYSSVREVTETRWHDKLAASAEGHFGHLRPKLRTSARGFISLINLLYIITEYFEFAARLAQAGVYLSNVSVSIAVSGVKDFVLTTESNRSWSKYCPANENAYSKEWVIAAKELISDSPRYSLDAFSWYVECFGWLNPNLDAMKIEQHKFLNREI